MAYNKLVEFVGCLVAKYEKIQEIESDMEILIEKIKFENIMGDTNTETGDKKASVEKYA